MACHYSVDGSLHCFGEAEADAEADAETETFRDRADDPFEAACARYARLKRTDPVLSRNLALVWAQMMRVASNPVAAGMARSFVLWFAQAYDHVRRTYFARAREGRERLERVLANVGRVDPQLANLVRWLVQGVTGDLSRGGALARDVAAMLESVKNIAMYTQDRPRIPGLVPRTPGPGPRIPG